MFYDTHIRQNIYVLQHTTLRLDETFLLFVGTSSKENEMKMYSYVVHYIYILQAVVTREQ